MAKVQRRCTRRVHSGQRGDWGGHQCGNYALEGSELCYVHTPRPEAVAPEDAAAKTAPLIERTSHRTYYATLTWKPGEGPLVKPPYRSGLGYVTKITAKATDYGRPAVSVWGVLQKKDGTPSVQHWDATYSAADILPAQYLAQVLEELEAQRRP